MSTPGFDPPSLTSARELYFDFFINQNFHNADEAETEDHHMYDFPFSVLRNGCVEILSLTRCYLNLPANLSTMRFRSIASMVLDDIYLTDQMVEDLLLGCPNLEAFEILGCRGPIHLKICSKRLKRLRIVLGDRHFWLIAPNICSINLDLCAFEESTFKNVSSLVEFRADLVHRFHQSYHQWSKVVRVLEQAPNLRILNVQNWWFKFLTSKDTFPKSFMLHNLTVLVLRTGFTQYDLVGMAARLKLCPNLKTLFLEFLFKVEKDQCLMFPCLPEELLDKPVEFNMPCLKQVTMEAYTGSKDDDKFMKILMRHEGALEKIVVVPFQGFENGEKKSLPPVVYRRRVSQVGSTVSSAAPNGI
ncbi:hypothetical protein C1H46_038620 [Malus baccata]|uniref:At1g61320/AtMIF1 LRR domain-containing protein n=1 Tax=Malus baccata TaxID=106549 RepID=A0A540KNS0_MALBA|nr:hypothetical protein C1H46_038620 [Malus baccata]